MSTTARPSVARRRVTASKRSASASVSTAVGSSRRSTSGSGVEGPKQLQSLALTHRHRRNRRRRVDLEVEPCGEIGEVVRRLRPRRPPMALGAEQQQVVDGHHRRHEGEVLLHERHAALPGVAGDAGANGAPARNSSPDDGRSRPPRMRIRVVLPAPFSPRIASTSPARTSRSTPQSAWTSPNRRETPTTSRAGAEPASTAIRG